MPKVLFITLGNRDMQLPRTARIERALLDHFEPGNIDTNNNDVIRKNDKLFLDHSRALWNHYEECASEVLFPMIERSIDLSGKELKEIVVITTQQTPLDTQDCHFIALFLERQLKEKGYNVRYAPITFPPVDLGHLVEFFTTLYEQYEGYNIFFGNSGGTPDMRTASHMAGMFRGIEFITLQARDKSSQTRNFKKQERLVLRHVAERMMHSYDYAGLMQLPLQDEGIQLLAEYAQTRLLLDHSRLNEISERFPYPSLQIPDIPSSNDLMKEIAQSARIKFHQRAYADYLWRIFTIGDNIHIPHIECILNGAVVFEKKDGHKKWHDLLNNQPELKQFLENFKINEIPLKIDEPNAYAYNAILKYAMENNIYSPPPTLIPLVKLIDDLRGLRNGIAHNMKGISLEQIEAKIPSRLLPGAVKGVKGLNTLICNHFGLPEGDIGVYDEINVLIRQRLSAS